MSYTFFQVFDIAATVRKILLFKLRALPDLIERSSWFELQAC